jgi:hypothetical protein
VRQLDAGEDDLDAEDEAAEVEGDGRDIVVRVCVLVWLEKGECVCEEDASEEGYDWWLLDVVGKGTVGWGNVPASDT